MKIFVTVTLWLSLLHLYAQTTEWEQSYALPENQSIVSFCNSDTGFLALGQGRNFDEFSEILKIDSFGNLLWRSPLIFTDTSISDSYSFDLVKVNNEFTYYISGFYFADNGTSDFIVKINSQGDTLWNYIYDPFGIYQSTKKLISLKDKSVLSVGYQQQNITQEDVLVRRLDSTGQLMWQQIYSLPGNQRAFDITEMLDGSLIISGSNGGDNLILKIGIDGALIQDTTFTGQGNGTIDHMAVSLLPGNHLLLVCDSWNGSWYDGQKVILNEELQDTWNVLSNEAFIDDFRINVDSTFLLENFMLPDSTVLNKYDFNLNKVSSFNLPNDSAIRAINSILSQDNSIFVSGTKSIGNDDDYWLAKISGVGEKWIPDRCSYQPPVAGFEYEYNYPVLTLRDTSSGGLKYLDTVYTWQWNTSVGTSGNEDSLLVFFDTAINKTIDIELVIGNWYGCTDTVNQTLVLGETGLDVFKELNVKAFPNPVKDIFNVHIESVQDELVFRLYDLQGRLQINELLHSDLSTISLSGLPRGLYFYDIRSKRQMFSIASGRGKIIKE